VGRPRVLCLWEQCRRCSDPVPGRAVTSGLRSVCDVREDVAVADSVMFCVVCRVTRMRGNDDHRGEVLVCAKCQADAAQLFAIQDSIWGEAEERSSPG
jgi:hypothetical protein